MQVRIKLLLLIIRTPHREVMFYYELARPNSFSVFLKRKYVPRDSEMFILESLRILPFQQLNMSRVRQQHELHIWYGTPKPRLQSVT